MVRVRVLVHLQSRQVVEYFENGLPAAIFCGHHRLPGWQHPAFPTQVMALTDIVDVNPYWGEEDRKHLLAAGATVAYRFGPDVWQGRTPLDSTYKLIRTPRITGLVECHEGPCTWHDLYAQAANASVARGWEVLT